MRRSFGNTNTKRSIDVKLASFLLTTLLLVLGFPAASFGADTKPEDVSALLEPVRLEHNLPALGGAIVDGPRVIAVGATGLRKTGGPDKVTTANRWHLGSCAKAMSATLIARLVEKRKLSWKTTIGQAFPNLRKVMRPEYRDVTLTQLLSHRGGITGSLLKDQELWTALRSHSGPPRKTRIMLVNAVLKKPPEAPPGTRYIYSNAGYTIAGAMAEQATGKSWEDLMKREVFGPLGMRSAGFGAPGGKQPWGHTDSSTGGQPIAPGPLAGNPAAISPAGAVHCSLEDWGRFVAIHLGAGTKGFLEKSTLDTLHTPFGEEQYALGWSMPTRGWAGGRVLTHAGTNTLWYAVVWAAPKRGFAVLVTTNQGGHAKACDDAVGVLMEYLEKRKKQ